MSNDEDLLQSQLNEHAPADEPEAKATEDPRKTTKSKGKGGAKAKLTGVALLAGAIIASQVLMPSSDEIPAPSDSMSEQESELARLSGDDQSAPNVNNGQADGDRVLLNDPDLDALLKVDGTIEAFPDSGHLNEGMGEEIFMGTEEVRQTVLDMDYVTNADFDRRVSNLITQNTFSAETSNLKETIRRQDNQIQALRASLESMESRMSDVNQQLRSTELKVMMQVERPVIDQLSLVVPAQDCSVCNSKAIFQWQGTRTLVSDGSEWMGYEVNIDGDVLQLVNGTVAHDYSPGL